MRWRVAAVVAGLLLLAGAGGFLLVRQQIPPGLAQDIRAGMSARHIADPDARLKQYLEARYGPLSDPAIRQKVFLDFFDPDHIKALQLMVRHSPESQRQGSILAMARWVEGYRLSLTGEERASLKARLNTPEGMGALRRATALYNLQDVQYRGQTAPVISQLLNTISSLQQP